MGAEGMSVDGRSKFCMAEKRGGGHLQTPCSYDVCGKFICVLKECSFRARRSLKRGCSYKRSFGRREGLPGSPSICKHNGV